MDSQTSFNPSRRETSANNTHFDTHSAKSSIYARRTCLKILVTGSLVAASPSVSGTTGLMAVQALLAGESAEIKKGSQGENARKLAELDRTISLYNTHTRETTLATFFKDGKYEEGALYRLNLFLRDHRENEAMVMDPGLFTQMWAINQLLDSNATFDIVSAYRTPKTNEYLRSKGSGVARFSYHMVGRAIDLRMRDVPTTAVRDAARELNAGGVGYYQDSGFVHIDTGDIRHWG